MHRTGGRTQTGAVPAARRGGAADDRQGLVLAVAATAGGLAALLAGQVAGEPYAAAVVGALAFVSTASVCASAPARPLGRRTAS